MEQNLEFIFFLVCQFGQIGISVNVFPVSVADRLGCDPRTRFQVPPNTKQWIALLQRGNCTFREKILRAASHNASAVVIYNNVSSEEPVTMTHQGKSNIISFAITHSALELSCHINYCERALGSARCQLKQHVLRCCLHVCDIAKQASNSEKLPSFSDVFI